ncbi:MAG: protein kinase [Kofleriaceae bacterium]
MAISGDVSGVRASSVVGAACPNETVVALFADAGLAGAARTQFEHHLDRCAGCRKLVAAMARRTALERTALAEGSAPHAAATAADASDRVQMVVVDPDHYVIHSELARGGMGRILAARDKRLGRQVAIKELLVESESLRMRFEREVRITSRLQHPNIVSVLHAGAWPSGELFYVMKLVNGESLASVIAERPTLEARLGLLANVTAAADALAYAHSMGVIHRDLKPSNVLIGDFGETVVIDWGLAKDLAEPSTPAPATTTEPSLISGATTVGSVLGTPAYMPAEQARGAAVDERTDVYALGAMLYHVLAGAPPYVGPTQAAIIEQVLAGPPPSIATRVSGLASDLVAIVDKAMAHDASDRYATAGELANDLKKFQTGQLVGVHHYTTWQLIRRWVRRHRATVAVTVTAAAVLIALGAVSVDRIIREQERAETSRADAEELMEFMLGDLTEKLRPIGKLELLDTVARKATDYYDHQPGELDAGAEDRRAKVRANLGDVLVDKGDVTGALASYQVALASAEHRIKTDSRSSQARRDLWMTHYKIGRIRQRQGDAPGALAAHRAALAVMEQLAASEPTDTTWQRNVAVSHASIAEVLKEQGDLDGAMASARASQSIKKQLVAAHPTNTRLKDDLRAGHGLMKTLLLVQRDMKAALVEARAALELGEQIVAADPANLPAQRDLLVAHQDVGDALMKLGNVPGAAVEYGAMQAIASKLTAADRSNTSWRRLHMVSHLKVGSVSHSRGDADAALISYRAALAIAELAVRGDASDTDAKRDRSIIQTRIGDLLEAQGDLPGTLAAYQAALASGEQLVAMDPANAEWQRMVAITQERVGGVLRDHGKDEEALAAFRKGLALSEQLAAKSPGNAVWQGDLALALARVAETLMEQNDQKGAIAAFQRATAVADALSKADPSNTEWQLLVSDTRRSYGTALLQQHDVAGARRELEATLAIREQLVATAPGNTFWQGNLASTRALLGDALMAQGDAKAAHALYVESLAANQRLAKAAPGPGFRQDAIVGGHRRVGDALKALGDARGARASYQTALKLGLEVAKQMPDSVQLREEVAELRQLVKDCCHRRTKQRT